MFVALLLFFAGFVGGVSRQSRGVLEEYFGGQRYEVQTPPRLPRQFQTTLVTVAHQANKTTAYPPWRQQFNIFYDFPARRARADVIEGFDAGRSFIRRYDLKKEYMVVKSPEEFAECRRSYLGEEFPPPQLPDMTYMGLVLLRDRVCAHWLHEADELSRIHVFTDARTQAPVRLTEEWVEDDAVLPLMTYEFLDLVEGPQDDALFSLPAPHTHQSCERLVGGQPYLHAFHWYMRF